VLTRPSIDRTLRPYPAPGLAVVLAAGLALGSAGLTAPQALAAASAAANPVSCSACLRASDPGECHRVATDLAARQDFKRAIAIEEQILTLQPRNAEVAASLARMYDEGLHDSPRAIALYHEALHAVSGYPPALLGLGGIMEAKGEMQIAARYYARAVKENPDVALFKIRLADTLMRGGREPEARPLLNEIVARWPGSREADSARQMMSRTALAQP